MKTPILPAIAVALLALTACQKKTETVTNTTTVENKTVAAAPLALPSIKGEASLRCHGDNSLVHVTFFEGDTQVTVQSPSDAPPVVLKAPEAGKPYVADGGWQLTGNAKAVNLTQPGKPAQSCTA